MYPLVRLPIHNIWEDRMMKESLKEFLKKASIFSTLNDKELDLLARNAHERVYPKNSYIIRKGEVGTSLFLIRSGEVKVILEKDTGDNVDLSILGRGNFFGEMSLFDVRPRSATVVAEADTTVIEICREDFLQEITKSSEISLKVLAEMASRFRHTDETVKEFDDKVHKKDFRTLEEIIRDQQEYAKTMAKLLSQIHSGETK